MIGPEDMVIVSDNTLIVSSTDRINLDLLHGPSKTEQGQMFVIYAADTVSPQVKKLPLLNFPSDINFYPHGIYLNKKNLLYVINHAYSNGGERVEVFKIKTILGNEQDDDDNENYELDSILGLEYKFSILFDEQFNGILNDLAVISKNQLLITKFLPYPDDVNNGRPFNPKMNGEITFWKQMYGIKSSYVLHCYFSPNTLAQCYYLDQTASSMNNGIAWNEKDTVIVSNTFEGKMSVYKLSFEESDKDYDNDHKGNHEQKGQLTLKFSEDLWLDGHPDNIEFDKKNHKFYVGIFGSIKGLFNYEKEAIAQKRVPNVEQWAGLVEIQCNNNGDGCDQETVLMTNQGIKACSAAVKVKDNIFFGSWSDTSVVMCSQNEEQQ